MVPVPQDMVRLQRLSDYPVFLSTVKHGDCVSGYGQTREVLDYRDVRLQRFQCKYTYIIWMLSFVERVSTFEGSKSTGPKGRKCCMMVPLCWSQ